MLLLCAVLLGCRRDSPDPPRPPASPDDRVAAAIVRWGGALERGDDSALAEAEDGGGKAVMVYAAVKHLASQVPHGGETVELTVTGVLLLAAIHVLRGGDGYPYNEIMLVLPPNSLNPALAEAGLAKHDNGYAFMVVPIGDLAERMRAASAKHRARLRERAAWTCKPIAIERTVLPSERSLIRLATTSSTFRAWLDEIDALWLVRARCADSDALFVVTGYRSGVDRVFAILQTRTRSAS